MNENRPSPAAANGRGSNGRFLPGNQAGQGNPLAANAQKLRVGLMGAVSAGDLRAVARKLAEMAKAGDVQAARLLLDRTLGPPVAADIEERIATLERLAETVTLNEEGKSQPWH